MDNYGSIPAFRYNLLVNLIITSNDSLCHMLPLLFKTARFKSLLKGFHPFYLMFKALANCKKLYSLDIGRSTKPSVATIMSLPIAEIFQVIDEDDSMNYFYNNSIKQSKVQKFV